MDEFTIEDLQDHTIAVKEIELLGKRAYLRKLTFDGQIFIGSRFQGRDDEDASAEDMRLMLACVLCDSAGQLLFDDPQVGADLLKNIESEELLNLIQQTQELNGQDIEAEKKGLAAIR